MRHVWRTHRVDLDRFFDRINLDPMIQIKYVKTTQQLADILTKGSFSGDWWTQLIQSANSMTHTTFTQRNLSVSPAGVNLLSFSSMSKRAWESFATSAGAKQNPVHCSATTARKSNDKNADKDYHAVLSPEYQAGGDSKRENMCRQDSVWKRHQYEARNIKLQTTGSGWSIEFVATGCYRRFFKWEESSSSSYIKKFDDPARKFEPQREEEHTIFFNQVLDRKCARFWSLQDLPLNVAIWSQFSSDCSYGLHLGLQRITKSSKGWRWVKVSENTRFTVTATTSANTDPTQRCIQHAGIGGLEDIVGQE